MKIALPKIKCRMCNGTGQKFWIDGLVDCPACEKTGHTYQLQESQVAQIVEALEGTIKAWTYEGGRFNSESPEVKALAILIEEEK